MLQFDMKILLRESQRYALFDYPELYFGFDLALYDWKFHNNGKACTLRSCYKSYLNTPSVNAHNALADCCACIDILLEMTRLDIQPTIPTTQNTFVHLGFDSDYDMNFLESKFPSKAEMYLYLHCLGIHKHAT